jgi:O-succinylbenzoic acid--CoA ligase
MSLTDYSTPPQGATPIPHPLQSTAIARPDLRLLTVSGEQHLALTARELRDRARRRAAVMANVGIGAGQTVALAGLPSASWVEAFFAIGWLGAIAAPLDPSATPSELKRQLDLLRPTLLIGADQPQRAAEALGVTARSLDDQVAGSSTIREPAEQSAWPKERPWPLGEPRVALFTSGSTGHPKLVTLETQQLLFSALGSAIRLGHQLDDCWLLCLPLHHIGGLSILLRAAWLGFEVELLPRFDAQRVADALDSGRVSLVSLVPTMLDRVLDARQERPFPKKLRAILLGGAACPRQLLARCQKISAPLCLSWGMTETASQVATSAPGAYDENGARGALPPLPFCRVESQEGRLTVLGPPAKGEHTTGDLGQVDAQHRITVYGRADDVVISGGKLIDPQEVADVLRAHPAVDDAVVIGRPNEQWGQRPVGVLVGAADRVTQRELEAHCRQRLSSFKIPDGFIWLQSLPRNAQGKLDRASLVEIAQSALASPAQRDITKTP